MTGRLTAMPEPVGAEVIDFADLGRTERLDIKRQEWDGCKHQRTWVDERLRIVTCKDCHEKLDPLEVLLDIAKHWRSESFQAKRIADFEAKQYAEATEREKRFVRQHVVCHGCGLQTRLTLGKLTEADIAAWDAHWGHEPEHESRWGDRTYTHPQRDHRRRTEADIEAARRHIEPAPLYGGAVYVDRRPSSEHNSPRTPEPVR